MVHSVAELICAAEFANEFGHVAARHTSASLQGRPGTATPERSGARHPRELIQ
jgi:hypothetical protein